MNEQFFSNGTLHNYLLQSIRKQGFQKPTFIQERLFPTIIKGQDAIGQSQTGTGKTLAYLLPLVQKINPQVDEIQVIIATPTRELARQIYGEFQKLMEFAKEEEKISAKLIIGGTDRLREQEKLHQKQPQLIIGSPGRIKDYISKQYLLSYTAFSFVVDEADMMLDMGFLEDVDYIAKSINESAQLLVFSATIPEPLEPFLKKYMNQPKFVQVPKKETANQNVEHWAISLRHRDRNEVVLSMMEKTNPFLALVFTNTKVEANQLYRDALEKGWNVGILHGGLAARERKKVMKEIHDLKYQYVIATDLAARGIDIKGVSHIFSVSFPKDLDFYIHRSGRTGRGNYTGICISIYDDTDGDHLDQLEKRGVYFHYYEFKNGEFTKSERRRRKAKPRQGINEEAPSIRLPKKSKKVKPGYKKKHREQVEKAIKKASRKKYRGK
ncbi:DEAD/DEAH box helicase [Massilibacterium senegalense]|uniref:DEAD/DEAH box helicase n=1 Tax=Massilibacterium senegalense TaxID=1632858 RepID=UPI000784E5E8|nr:DEAD/DEAH box helicase [Massilibacterium senegalense]